MTRAGPTADELQWALAEASKEAVGVAPGWFRAWPTGDEKWSVVNVRANSLSTSARGSCFTMILPGDTRTCPQGPGGTALPGLRRRRH